LLWSSIADKCSSFQLSFFSVVTATARLLEFDIIFADRMLRRSYHLPCFVFFVLSTIFYSFLLPLIFMSFSFFSLGMVLPDSEIAIPDFSLFEFPSFLEESRELLFNGFPSSPALLPPF